MTSPATKALENLRRKNAEALEAAEREVEVRELIDTLDRALATLSPDHRTIVILRDLEGLEYREISDLIGVPVGTVRSRLNRARARLRASADVSAPGAP